MTGVSMIPTSWAKSEQLKFSYDTVSYNRVAAEFWHGMKSALTASYVAKMNYFYPLLLAKGKNHVNQNKNFCLCRIYICWLRN